MNNRDPFLMIRTHLTETARLTPDERDSLWGRICNSTETSTASPYIPHVFSYKSRIHEYVTALVILGLLGGVGGVSAAAEQSIPGSVLYPIKIEVTEPARELLLLTPTARANWQVTLLERRLVETREVLQQPKQSDAKTLAEVGEHIKEHANKAQQLIKEITKTDTNEGIRIAVNLATTVEKNIEVLKIENKISENISPTDTLSLAPDSQNKISDPISEEQPASTKIALDNILAIAESVHEAAQETTSILVEQSGDQESASIVAGNETYSQTPDPVTLEFDQIATDVDSLITELESTATVTPTKAVSESLQTTSNEYPTNTDQTAVIENTTISDQSTTITNEKTPSQQFRIEFQTIIHKKLSGDVSVELLSELKKLRTNIQVFIHSPQTTPTSQSPNPVITTANPVATHVDPQIVPIQSQTNISIQTPPSL